MRQDFDFLKLEFYISLNFYSNSIYEFGLAMLFFFLHFICKLDLQLLWLKCSLFSFTRF